MFADTKEETCSDCASQLIYWLAVLLALLTKYTYCNELNMPALESSLHITIMLSCLHKVSCYLQTVLACNAHLDVAVEFGALSNLDRPPLLITSLLCLIEASLHLVVLFLLRLMRRRHDGLNSCKLEDVNDATDAGQRAGGRKLYNLVCAALVLEYILLNCDSRPMRGLLASCKASLAAPSWRA